MRTEPERVYQRALRLFTPDEIAEAFAATRGVASPTQLRAFMKRDPRDLLVEFRALAPHRRPIRLQRLSLRRLLTGAGPIAWMIGRRFEAACEKLGLNKTKAKLTTEHFSPPRQQAAQLSLF